VTPAPRIHGSQTAFVTAEPQASGAVIHVGDQIGCVRLRFHWDTDEERLAKEPSSCWVRVSQMFAGAGEGAVWHPRVGVEVIVEFLEGDPDRPIVTGRVYNGANIPPAPAAGAEEIRMHAGKDWNTVVENDRTELMKANSSSTVSVDRTESTGATRSTMVKATNTERVGGSESITVGSNQTLSVGSNQTVLVGANQTTSIDGWQTIDVEGPYQKITVTRGDQTVDVKGTQDVTVRGAKQWFHILGTQDFDVTGEIQYSAEEKSALVSKLGQSLSDATKQTFSAPWQEFKTTITDKSGLRWQEFFSDQFRVTADSSITIQSPAGKASLFGHNLLELGSSTALQVTGGDIVISGGSIIINGGDVTINAGEGKNVTVNGKDVTAAAAGTASVHGASSVTVSGAIIKLNC
jgi:type VI secretion system secreted protein VgrG